MKIFLREISSFFLNVLLLNSTFIFVFLFVINTTHEANDTKSKGAEVYSDKAISVVGVIHTQGSWLKKVGKKKSSGKNTNRLIQEMGFY